MGRMRTRMTMVGGCVDAYAYIVYGGVFANAQTGNLVLLAINMADRMPHLHVVEDGTLCSPRKEHG